MKNYHDIVLALAGVCQSAKLVHQLATESRADSDTFLTALNSLFITQPQRIEDVFGGEVRHFKIRSRNLNSPAQCARRSKFNSLLVKPFGIRRKIIQKIPMLNKH